MKSTITALLLTVLVATSVNAEELFDDCETNADKPGYHLLENYFTEHQVDQDQCQKLNNHEFLYTTGNNVYYCKSIGGAPLECELDNESAYYPDLSIIKKFTGKRGKQFVLFKTELLRHGSFGEGYSVLYLVPKRINPRGYVIEDLSDAGSSDENDGEGVCGEPSDGEVVISSGPQIVNEEQDDVTIQFKQKRIDCKTNVVTSQLLEFAWQSKGFTFEKTKDLIEVIKR